MAIAAEDGASLRIDKFMGENFRLWKFKMQMVLEERDFCGIASGEEVEPTGEGNVLATIQKFRKRARKRLPQFVYPSGTSNYRSFTLQRQPKKLGISLKITTKLSL